MTSFKDELAAELAKQSDAPKAAPTSEAKPNKVSFADELRQELSQGEEEKVEPKDEKIVDRKTAMESLANIPIALQKDREFHKTMGGQVVNAISKLPGPLQMIGAYPNVAKAAAPLLNLPFERVEAAVANPLLQVQAGQADPGRMARAVGRGVTGEEIGEIGDIYKFAAQAMGAPPEMQELAGIVGGLGTVSVLGAVPVLSKAKAPELTSTQRLLKKLDARDAAEKAAKTRSVDPILSSAVERAMKVQEVMRHTQQIVPEMRAASVRLGAHVNDARRAELRTAAAVKEQEVLTQNPDLYAKFRGHLLERQFIKPAELQLRSMGESGKSLADVAITIRNESADMAGEVLADLDPLLASMTEAEIANVIPAFNKKAKPVSEKVELFSQMFNEYRQRYFDEAQRLKVETINPTTGERRPIGFNPEFPEMFSREFFSSASNKEKILKQLVDQGQAKDRAQAARMLENFGASVARSGHLERPKMTGIAGDITDPRQITAHFFRSEARRLAEIRAFGQDNQGLTKYVDAVENEVGKGKQAQDIMDRYLRILHADEEVNATVQSAMDITAMWKLSKAGLSQMGDRIRLITDTGITTSLRALKQSFTKEGTAFAIRALGETPASSKPILEMLNQGKLTDTVLNKFYRIGPVDFNGRVMAANAGRLEAIDTFRYLQKSPKNPVMRLRLQQWGIDPDTALSRGGLTQQEMIQVARYKDRILQRRDKVMDFPLVFSNVDAASRLSTQFRAPSYDVTRFMFDEGNRLLELAKLPGIVGKTEAAKRLARLIAATTTIGGGVGTTKAVLSGKFGKEGTDPLKFALLEQTGVLGDLVESPGRNPSGLVSFVAGPTPGSWSEVLFHIFDSFDPGKRIPYAGLRRTAKFALKQIPFVGGAVSEAVVPKPKRRSRDLDRD